MKLPKSNTLLRRAAIAQHLWGFALIGSGFAGGITTASQTFTHRTDAGAPTVLNASVSVRRTVVRTGRARQCPSDGPIRHLSRVAEASSRAGIRRRDWRSHYSVSLFASVLNLAHRCLQVVPRTALAAVSNVAPEIRHTSASAAGTCNQIGSDSCPARSGRSQST